MIVEEVALIATELKGDMLERVQQKMAANPNLIPVFFLIDPRTPTECDALLPPLKTSSFTAIVACMLRVGRAFVGQCGCDACQSSDVVLNELNERLDALTTPPEKMN